MRRRSITSTLRIVNDSGYIGNRRKIARREINGQKRIIYDEKPSATREPSIA